MTQAATTLATPRTDDRLICDLTDRVTGSFAIAIAHDLGLFRLLHESPRTAAELCAALPLSLRRVEGLLLLCAAAGLVDRRGETHSLTTAAEEYLIESSPTYAGYLFELWSGRDAPFTYENLRSTMLDESAGPEGRRLWSEAHRFDFARARRFTRMMHGHSMAPALAWPGQTDLCGARRMLDVGGGSGAHSIGAALRWAQLEATVLDLPAVCAVAAEYIAGYGLEERVRTHIADMWNDPFPEADLHFYSDIFHNWSPQEGMALAQKSFDALPRGGRILIHETLYDDDKRGPFTVAAASMAMLVWCGGQQYSGAELSTLLRETGFHSVEVRPTFGYWSLVSGWKP